MMMMVGAGGGVRSVFGEGADIIIVILHITFFLMPLFIPSHHVTLLSLFLSLTCALSATQLSAGRAVAQNMDPVKCQAIASKHFKFFNYCYAF